MSLLSEPRAFVARGADPVPTARAMHEFDSDPALGRLFDGWRRTGRPLIEEHYREFQALLGIAEENLRRGRFADAAADAQVVANYATFFHPGLFVSASLERMLRSLGEAALSYQGRVRPRPAGTSRSPLRVLHIATDVRGIGGHTRNMWRWISQDRANDHSVALTRHHRPIPDALLGAVKHSRGSVFFANRALGGLLGWARQLQRIVDQFDLVVLHVNNDVVPFLALAGMTSPPPAIILNHADHVFGIGAGCANLVAHTRWSGHELSQARRGIPKEHSAVIPLCMELPALETPRAEARRRLGLAEGTVAILTIARAVKFRDIDGSAFPDPLVDVLRHHPNTALLVVGPGGQVDWSAADRAAQGRIRVVPETPETATYLSAADIYLDSFPFVSITSLFEAGLHGLPIVTRAAFGPGCRTMAADSVGLDEVLLRTGSATELRALLDGLISDRERRETIGRRTREHIMSVNLGDPWVAKVNSLYELAVQLPVMRPAILDCPQFEDIDLFSPFVFGQGQLASSRAERATVAAEDVLGVGPRSWYLRQALAIAREKRRPFLDQALWRHAIPGRARRMARTLFRGGST